jgi:hypothetical protein
MQQEKSIDSTETGSRPCLDISGFGVATENFCLLIIPDFPLLV